MPSGLRWNHCSRHPSRPIRWAVTGLAFRTGCAWWPVHPVGDRVVVGRHRAILDRQVSDTTLRARRDQWIDAGAFEKLEDEALAAFDRIVGLDLDTGAA